MAMTACAPANGAILGDRQAIDGVLEGLLAGDGGTNPVLAAMRYAVLGPGQRLRPLIALRVGRVLGSESPAIAKAAAAVELIHCASLIVDDLPSMDDSPMRRGRASAHVAFGEPAALMAAFSLVASAGTVDLAPAGLAAQERFRGRLMGVLDPRSLVAGQLMDLEVRGGERKQKAEQISDLKTVPLFQVAAHAGAILEPPNPDLDAALDAFGRAFGLAYQWADDYLDGETQDAWPARAYLARAREILEPFGPRAAEMDDMLDYLDEKTFEARHRHR